MRECPFCKFPIPVGATICGHCRTDFNELERIKNERELAEAKQQQEEWVKFAEENPKWSFFLATIGSIATAIWVFSWDLSWIWKTVWLVTLTPIAGVISFYSGTAIIATTLGLLPIAAIIYGIYYMVFK
jgi:hypothetical protein